MIKVTEQNLNELANTLEILEVLDDGIRFYGSRNGVVVREMFAKWGDSISIHNGITDIMNLENVPLDGRSIYKDDFPVLAKVMEEMAEDKTEEIVMQINLPESAEKALEVTSEAEVKEMTEVAMEKVMKTKKTAKKSTKKVDK